MLEPSPRLVWLVFAALEHELFRGKHVMRYASEDDFGLPESAFLIWPVLVDRRVLEAMVARYARDRP